jgi:hypothetical protein
VTDATTDAKGYAVDTKDCPYAHLFCQWQAQTLPEIWNGAPFQELRRNLVDRHPERSAACDGCDLPYDDAKFSWPTVQCVGAFRCWIRWRLAFSGSLARVVVLWASWEIGCVQA